MEESARKERVNAPAQQVAVSFFVMKTVSRVPTELAAPQNVSVWRRIPWNAVPKMVVAPANLVTKATDARKMASGDQRAGSPLHPVKMEVSATKKLEIVTSLLITQENPVPYYSPGMFGDDCHQLCDCEGETFCHPKTEKCLCPPGRTGAKCDAG
ncbi:hypothetical protein CK820_G0006123 [Pan troglodytes]|uniref:EGF-like domain-containing protein n=1 Tax=Pan troglodytes TaxID=9598 RepID=A0A2J8P1N4_PANTR|nr:hypothetical protein CK820_G0006123 [Pan troglodytes]